MAQWYLFKEDKVSLTSKNQLICFFNFEFVSVWHKNKTNRCMEERFFYKEVGHILMETSKAKIFNVGQQTQDSGDLMVQMKSESSPLDDSPSLREPVFFTYSGLQILG